MTIQKTKDINKLFLEDENIKPVHISLYYAFCQLWEQDNCPDKLIFSRSDVMFLSKINSVGVYTSTIKYLDSIKAISYTPSKSLATPSFVSLSYIGLQLDCNRTSGEKSSNEEFASESKKEAIILDYDTIIKSEDFKEYLLENKIKITKIRVSNEVNKDSYSEEVTALTLELTKLFPEAIVSKLTKKQRYKWVDTVDKLITIDKYEIEEIKRIVKLARKDDFYHKVFLSLNKLRSNNKDGIKYIDFFKERFSRSKMNMLIGVTSHKTQSTAPSIINESSSNPDRMKM